MFGPGSADPGVRGFGGPGGPLDDVAKALGISTEKLFEQLRDGKSIADIAKAEGKSLADVKKTLRASAEKRLDKAVEDGDLTRKQADEILEHMKDHVDRLGDGMPFGPPGGPRGGDRDFGPGDGDFGPGDGDFGPPPGVSS